MNAPGAERVIRVFVSSTFRDMSQERDRLAKFVFPELRKLCETRHVVWGEVDLRWGITDEQAAEDKVLPVCLEEIQRCRPYFIGLLGERYGWVPQQIPFDLLQTQPWIRQHKSRSVTELEIIHGVLRNQQMHGRAFFYFRDPAYLGHLPAGSQRTDFEPESANAQQKLLDLKQRIREASDQQICLLRENYGDPEQLGEWILQDFTKLIEILFPAEERPDPLAQETTEHEAFSQTRQRVYIGRQEYFERLDQHARAAGHPLVLLGESGVGKSALLANWASRYVATHPSEPVLLHFVGATRQSTDWAAMLRRLMSELKRAFAIGAEVPSDPDQLRAAFGNWLHMAATSGRFVVILDGLNQLEDRNGALDLAWLPPESPGNARLLLSTLPGRPLDEFLRRGWPTLQVQPLERKERLQLISQYLAQYTKTLSQARAQRIAAAPQSANPLYLRGLLEELRLFGSHDELDQCIDGYLQAASPAELYQKILARWESDYDAGMNLVGNAMSLLWAARRGLSEAELLDLLGTDPQQLPGARWSPLYLAAEHTFVNRSGLLNFAHQYLREAVRQRYLSSDDANAVHMRLANYFETKMRRRIHGDHSPFSTREIDELPWQLNEAESWERLARIFSHSRQRGPQFLSAAWDHNQFDVLTYWNRLETCVHLSMVGWYRVSIDFSGMESDIDFLNVLALLLNAAGHIAEAKTIDQTLVRRAEISDDDHGLQLWLGGLADALLHQGDLAGAEAALLRQEEICRHLGDDKGLGTCLASQGLVQLERGRLKEAMELHKRHEEINRARNDLHGIGISINNQALVAYLQRDYQHALDLYRKEELACRQLGDLDGLQHSFGGQANCLEKQGHLVDVMDLYHRQEDICRQLGNKIGMILSLGNQAAFLRKLGNLAGAMKKHREEETLCRETGYQKGLAISLGNQANTLEEMGKRDEALEKYHQEEEICRKIDNSPVLEGCLRNQARLLMLRDDYAGAWQLFQEEEAILRDLGPQEKIAEALGVKALILKNLGRPISEVRAVLKEQEQLCRELGNPEWLAGALINQAYHLEEASERQRALDEARRLAQQHGLPRIEEAIKEVDKRLSS